MMTGFVGRQHELDALGRELAGVRDSGSGAFLWMRGRRRVGKSRLVEQFLLDTRAPSAFFRSPRREPAETLRRFAATVAQSSLASAPLFADGLVPDSWVSALRLAAQGATSADPAVIVIDELPYLLERDNGADADLQEAWDRDLQHLPVMLIAIGSDVTMMESLVDYGHALHGRPTRHMVVAPFSPAEVAQLTEMDAAAAFDAYLVVGGFPTLATMWRKSWDRRRFLEEALADSHTYFVVNGERILDNELPYHPQGRQVLEAIGAGERTFSTLRDASGVFSAKSLTNALKLLVDEKRIVAESSPCSVPAPKKSKRYSIADPHLRFWLRFVGPGIDEIDRGRGDLVRARIERAWPAYRGKAIEDLVRRSIERMLPDARFGSARYVGGYWTRNNDVEVDLIGADSPDPSSVAFVGSVKWRERARFGPRDTRELIRLRSAVPGAEDALLIGVSRSGFTADAGLDVALTPADLIAAWRPAGPKRAAG
jgi:AAA+ ATPase superfamily predicted ATPase